MAARLLGADERRKIALPKKLGKAIQIATQARRHLTCKDKAIIAVESLPLYEAEAAERQKQGRGSDGSGGRGHKKNLPQQIGEGFSNEKTEKPKKLKSHEGEAVAKAAKAAGTNRQYVADANTRR
jgi:hypothetical protein